MKKFAVIFTVICAVLLCLTMTACTDDKVVEDVDYDMNISIDGNVIVGSQTVNYVNAYSDGLNYSVFHLYPNAYSENASNPAYLVPLDVYGGITINSVKSSGVDLEFSISENGEYLTINHAETKLGDTISLEIEYLTTLPTGKLRLANNDTAYTLSGFYPQLSVYDGGAFRQDNFSAIGDPIFSACADYSVTLECAKNLVVCSSSKASSVSDLGERQKVVYNAKNVRDFAIVASPDYNVINTQVGDINVYYFYVNDDTAQDTLSLTADALRVFSENFGEYPYDTYTVVRVPFVADGMEYSGLSLVAEKCSDLEDTIIHETAHQWWYGIVGSDSIYESYMDEGLSTFSSAYYYKLNGDEDKFKEKMKSFKRAYFSYERLQQKRKNVMSLAMNKPIYEYTEYQYTMVQYLKSSVMFDSLRELYGDEKFLACLKKYYADNKFSIAGKDAFISSANETLGDISGLINGWIGEKVVATTFNESV